MFSQLLILSAVLLSLVTAVTIALFYQSDTSQIGISPSESAPKIGDRNHLVNLLDFIMQYPLAEPVELGILSSLQKTCISSPKGALHLSWQQLEKQLFRILMEHSDQEKNGELSLEFLLWTDIENELPGFALPIEVDRALLRTMIEIDKIMVRNPIMPFTSEQSEKYLKLSAHLINQMRHFKQIKPI
ncbi:hypothetical protein MJ923_14730 [Shewanella sp. 3B26]|uniref:Uncharacterized protein n=1 Tax=Shewanella zhuhaiensis TaxID=2919576 RepID=A0AAJ1BIZ2_9GAMM|nr:hypothetical protein [Shewanella zhuhaiensis]MCH4295561.1 hypothetical protein [Shewanella zhuhaiensis]